MPAELAGKVLRRLVGRSFAPSSDRIANHVPGQRGNRKLESTLFKVRSSFLPQGDQGVDLGGAARR